MLWIRLVPLSLSAIHPADRAQFTYRDAGGGEHVYLGGFDSYYWLRLAQNVLQAGTVCDAVVDGRCRDTRRLAPVGARVDYERSLHIYSIAGLHRLIAFFEPDQPLPASAFLVSVLVGMLGVLPAFAVGRHLAGSLAGLFAALLVGLNPLFLARSGNGDNDVWNVVLPLYMLWAALTALRARTVGRQIAWSAAATLVATIHALTWKGWFFTWVLLLAGLALHAGMVFARAAVRSGWTFWRGIEVRRAAVVLLSFCVTGAFVGAATGIGVAELQGRFAGAMRSVSVTSAGQQSARVTGWPRVFETVSELEALDLRGIADSMGGAPYFFMAWLGLLFLFLPRRDWKSHHFAVLVAGTCLYWFLLMVGVPGRWMLLLLLSLPLAVASLLYVVEGDSGEGHPRGGVVVVLWFLAALYLSFNANRYAMLLVPPFGLALGVAVGRLYEWLLPFAARFPAPERAAYRPVVFVVLCLFLVGPVRLARRDAQARAPRVSDAWWEAFERIRKETPAESIVSTWWPHGYWAQYRTERRVTADGGVLGTRVPHWLARALLAPTEEESIGLLRMLHCGSDAPPWPGEPRGAYQLLLEQGVDGIVAHDTVIELARRDREEAGSYLETQGVGEPARSEILAVTHCEPPPGYLIVSSALVRAGGWKHLAGWNFRRAYVSRRLRSQSETDVVAALVESLGYSRQEAQALYRQAAALPDERARRDFVAPPLRYFGRGWAPCRRAGAEMVCPLSAAEGQERVADEFAYPRSVPERGELRRHRRAGPSATPVQIFVAAAERIEAVAAPAAARADVGVVVDTENERVLVGSPELLQSTFTHLVFLDGRYAKRFRKFDDRIAYGGERIVTWELGWE